MNPSFAYIYDDFLSESRHAREVALLETELARRGIEGRMARLAMFRNPRAMIADLTESGVKNIVFVGSDATVQKMTAFLPDISATVGFLPLVEPTSLATLLGIPAGILSVDVLAARSVETFDVGKIGDRFFFAEVVLPSTDAALEIEGQYRMSAIEGGNIAIRNLGSLANSQPSDAKDGLLEAVIQTREPTPALRKLLHGVSFVETSVRFRRGAIVAEKPTSVFVDGERLVAEHLDLQCLPQKIRFITGRGRSWKELGAGERKTRALAGTKRI